jgi:lysophospholipase L1-like esterase
MRHRSSKHVVKVALVAACAAMFGLVAVPGVAQTAGAAKPARPFYVSLGDSYSVGYQPTSTTPTGGTPGYTAFVAEHEKMTLANFGCGGATTSSIINSLGCGNRAAFNAEPYTGTQEQGALDFIGAHPGQVGLVTVSIGGNDITGCLGAGTLAQITSCVVTQSQEAQTNVTKLVGNLHAALTAAGDTTTRIVGLTYPDVILGLYVVPGQQALAASSTVAFDGAFNPALAAAYGSVPNGSFVNVTQAPYKRATTGDDSDTTTAPLVSLKPYGKIPPAVWEVCKLTYFCSSQNIHANTKGYKFIGKLIVASLAPAA